jgi:anthranilate 1,2-dioxygenase large subunit/terephthalate 1,2-dioxygenase oxygenase component alpha subunit
MTGGVNSQHAWPDEGATRVPDLVYQDADLYEAEQKLIFRGPVWNYLGLEVEIPSAGDYITGHVGDTPVIVVRTAEGGINALVNRCAHKGSMIYCRPSGHMSELTCPYRNWVYDFAGNLKSVAFRPWCPRTMRHAGRGDIRFRKRSVVLDSSPIDTLLVIPL